MEARGVRSLFALFVIRDRAGKRCYRGSTRMGADLKSKNLTTETRTEQHASCAGGVEFHPSQKRRRMGIHGVLVR
jgi:hypothetical protein